MSFTGTMENLDAATNQTNIGNTQFPFSVNYDGKPRQDDSFLKVNGDHSVPQQIFPSDEDTSSSHSSSSSPRNLVIDHQDESSRDGAEENAQKNNLKNDNSEKKVLKRKLSLRDSNNPYLPKKRRFSSKAMDSDSAEKPHQQSSRIGLLYQLFKEEENRREEHSGPFQEYAQYLGLKPAVPIKCFKCSNSSFENLSQLRDHQKLCLFKDKQRNTTITADLKMNVNAQPQFATIPAVISNDKPSENTTTSSNTTIAKTKETSSPGSNTTAKAKKKVFLCSACGTYYENWNLFLHMREVHKRHICLYCVGMFPSAERLTFHLEMKHDLEQNHFDSQEKLLRSSRDSCYLMCCVCEHLFTEHDDFSDHVCSEHIQPCPLCGQKGRHNANCKAATAQPNRTKHKDHHTKRKNKNTNRDPTSSLMSSLSGQKRKDVFLKGNQHHETSILRQIITQTDSSSVRSENQLFSPLKVNGCTTETETNVLENENSFQRIVQQADNGLLNSTQDKNLDNGDNQIEISQSNADTNRVITQDFSNNNPSHNESHPADHLEPDRFKANVSLESSLSQSNNNTDVTSESTSTPNETLNDSIKSADLSRGQESTNEPKLLLVPKFKIKIPKEFQTPLESEHSSTESDENDLDRSENIEEQSEEDMDLEEKADNCDINKNEDKIEDKIEEAEHKSVDKIEPKNEEEEPEKSQSSSPLIHNEIKEDNDMEIKEEEVEKLPEVPSDGIIVADEDVLLHDLLLDRPLDRIEMVEFMRICLRVTFRICLYCNHARRIAVNAHSLGLHLISHHRFSATVDSITAEELQPSTIVLKLKSFLPELEAMFFNLETYCSSDKENLMPYEKMFECFQCRFETRVHKELYLHNRKMHLKTAILCFMCRANFFSYSEILCHMCPGQPKKCVIFDIQFRCCLCDIDNIPSAFRLMVHLRKKHFACDVCLEDCHDQSRLSSHVWKHKLHHLCYRCGIAYRNKPDITKHLFWKHGTESVLCKRCLQKRWPHVYHFCIPPTSFVCEICNLTFSKAMALKVHKRLHSGDAPYPCTEDDCDKKFISRKLLLKHVARHNELPEVKIEEPVEAVVEESIMEPVEPKAELKEEEIIIKTEEIVKEADYLSKRKRKKSKKNKENLDDLMDMPAPNLSESDSSTESESEKTKMDVVSAPMPNVMLSPASDPGGEEDAKSDTQIMDIWENFKTFQASQAKTVEDDSDENDVTIDPPILHVTQSDHDYCMMFKPISKVLKSLSKDDINEIKTDVLEEAHTHSSPKKKQKAMRKVRKSGSESSSSGSSSSSDSSCTCGSNCSCSSSSGSSSDSSSSSDSDSSSSEGKRRIAARRAAKLEKKNRVKSEEKKPPQLQEPLSPKGNTCDLVDVVTTDTKPQEVVNPDSIILESDLETDESATDEDFYDDHPQKLANQLLDEKRRQLMIQTSLSPSHNFDIVENSRPSTPSLPEEIIKEKKVKIKKKKRDRKASKNNVVPIFKLNIPPPPINIPIPVDVKPVMAEPFSMVNLPLTPLTVAPEENLTQVMTPPLQPPANVINTNMPAPIAFKTRLSTGSSSDADAPLKRSKRRRRPNKFYGYSSDDDMGTFGLMTGAAAFKPTPPPNLTWRKEDLPTPSKTTSFPKSIKTTTSTVKKSTPVNTPPLPPIPPIIIRPSALLTKKPMSVENALHKPPVVQPIRVPPVPVHHIRPPQYISPNRESFDDSESSSDDDNRLTIMAAPATKASTASATTSHVKQQQQQLSSSPVPSPAVPTINSQRIPPALLPNPDLARLQYFQRNNIRYPIQPPAGARPPREGESVYCYCRCPYDEVSEMIACDGDECVIEWFHFECVGIMVPPQGKWFCPECRTLYPNDTAKNFDDT